MMKYFGRLMIAILGILIASGATSGALAVSEIEEINLLEPGALTGVNLSGEIQRYRFSPSANGEYGVYVLPLEPTTAAVVRLFSGETLIAEGEGSLQTLSLRLNAEEQYILEITGRGAALL